MSKEFERGNRLSRAVRDIPARAFVDGCSITITDTETCTTVTYDPPLEMGPAKKPLREKWYGDARDLADKVGGSND